MPKRKNGPQILLRRLLVGGLVLVGLYIAQQGTALAQATAATPAVPSCNRTITANVVAIDQIVFYNRYGAFNDSSMIFALKSDVVPVTPGTSPGPANAQLRPNKRPRPMILRANVGDCLVVNFTNWLGPNPADLPQDTNIPLVQPYTGPPITPNPGGTPTTFNDNTTQAPGEETATRNASFHVNGLDLVGSIASSGSFVGDNPSSLVAPGQSKTYEYYCAAQGQYVAYSSAAVVGGDADGGQTRQFLFGSVNVEPQGATWYRSQVTNAVLTAATTGTNPNGTPKINYAAKDSSGNPLLNMLNSSNQIVATDLNAIITGFTENCGSAPPSSTCGQPFREFTTMFHDSFNTVEPFDELGFQVMSNSGDNFAMDYGSSGMGTVDLANRGGLHANGFSINNGNPIGPTANCNECKFEEFFLNSWANGDPALLVTYGPDGIANGTAFPDDPSNVHHSYIGDPVRFRNMHAGVEYTHVFHLHSHQWLHTFADQNSTYFDSQAISPSVGYTYEINYGGSGNRNSTPGDAIFHCHIYPHFSQGMWSLWRNHDTFENGSIGRNLPDGEIPAGTANPAIVPIPGKPLPPMPTASFPGYPFYIAGQAGHRPPQPALDMTIVNGVEQNGGLPRHRVLSATTIDGQAAVSAAQQADPVAARVNSDVDPGNTNNYQYAFARVLTSANLQLLPQGGTTLEVNAENFHAGLAGGGVPVTTEYGWQAIGYPSFTSSGAAGNFLVNGRAPQHGAPYADPCPNSVPVGNSTLQVTDRTYNVAYIQFDMTINSSGWHDRQARIVVAADDVTATLNGSRPPEPFFFRANSGECVIFNATNLMPAELNLDDFQVFNPTDTIGQHIHLVKFDVTSSDGAANGFNYEDATFSPEEVRERIAANNAYQQSIGGTQILTPVTSSVFGAGPGGAWIGAQTTTQRWWADPLVNQAGQDRTIRTVFTHDHLSPSTHQLHGLYAGLIVEPTGSTWFAQNGTQLGTRSDGGPTSFAAVISTPAAANSYREFCLEVADFAIVYTPQLTPVNPPNAAPAPLPIAVNHGSNPSEFMVPEPEFFSTQDPGTHLIDYRQEPIFLRFATNTGNTDTGPTLVQNSGTAGDLANVFSSFVHGDPFTHTLEAYEGDNIQIRLLQGAQANLHMLHVSGAKWLTEPSAPNSGFADFQHIGISEHFEPVFTLEPTPGGSGPEAAATPLAGSGFSGEFVDHIYAFGAVDDYWEGMWGILRAFKTTQQGLMPLPSNPNPGSERFSFPNGNVCPEGAPLRTYNVGAYLSSNLLSATSGNLVYNNRFDIEDPNAILFVNSTDQLAYSNGTKRPEPLILRANAGDCIQITLQNNLPSGTMPEQLSFNLLPPDVENFNFNQFHESNRVGLHMGLVSLNPATDDGARVGFNPDTTVGPGETQTYTVYAGDRVFNSAGTLEASPIEFGATAIRDMGDVVKHSSHGAEGALIIEPQGSTWTTDSGTNASATVDLNGSLAYREFVVIFHDDLTLNSTFPFPDTNPPTRGCPGGLDCINGVVNSALLQYAGGDQIEDSGQKGINYRQESLRSRQGFPPEWADEAMNAVDQTNDFSSTATLPGCNGPCGDPVTPVFTANVGTPVRFRLVVPASHHRVHGFTIEGHNYQEEPWINNSTTLGSNPLSNVLGANSTMSGPTVFNILVTAGGLNRIAGDYLFRMVTNFETGGGEWGIFRVTR
ncbi:MAG TPA: copper oxidase [Blastocatellia bacterium]